MPEKIGLGPDHWARSYLPDDDPAIRDARRLGMTSMALVALVPLVVVLTVVVVIGTWIVGGLSADVKIMKKRLDQIEAQSSLAPKAN